MKRLRLKEFSFLHALFASLLLHGLTALSFVSFNSSDAADIHIDSAPGQAHMRFAFARNRNGFGSDQREQPHKDATEEQNGQTAQVDPGLLTSEISKIMREIEYPPLALRMGMQGTASFQISTDTSGRVAEIVMIRSSGYDLLDRSAAARLKEWDFPFAKRTFIIPVRFQLTDK